MRLASESGSRFAAKDRRDTAANRFSSRAVSPHSGYGKVPQKRRPSPATLLFGPLVLLYTTIKGGVIMTAVDFFFGVLIFATMVAASNKGDPNKAGAAFLGGLALIWLFALGCHIASVVWAVPAAQSYNREIQLSIQRT
jgi:hypothetical protein